MKILISIIALLISFNAYPRGKQKCVDEKGKVSYQDRFCSDNLRKRAKLKSGNGEYNTFRKHVTIVDGRVVDNIDEGTTRKRLKEYNRKQNKDFLENVEK